MPAKFRLRRFLYLDGDLTDNFLSQTGADIFEEEALTEESESSRSVTAGLRAGPAQAGAGGGKGRKTTSSRTVKQTAESSFTRLAGVLEDNGAVQYLEALDDDIWNDMRRGEVVEAECNIAVPLLLQFGLLVASAPVSDIAKAFGTTVDADTEKTIQQIGTLIGMLKVLPVMCELAASPKYKFVAPINPAALRVALDDLSGEATVFATIEKKIKGRETWNLLDAFGLGRLPRDTRRNFEREVGKAEALRDFKVSAPAALLSPVAIYR